MFKFYIERDVKDRWNVGGKQRQKKIERERERERETDELCKRGGKIDKEVV